MTTTIMFSYEVGNNSSTNTTDFDKTATITESWICVVLIVTGLLINILVLTALVTVSDEIFNKSVRLIFSIIVGGCILIGTSGLILSIMNLICGYFNLTPSIGVCRAYIGLYLIGGAVRYTFMATNAIVIFLLVRLKNAVKIWKISVALTVVLLLIIVALCLPAISESVTGVLFIQGVSCFPYSKSNSNADIYLGFLIILFPVLSYVIVITVPILTLFYLKQHNISGDIGPQRALIKFNFLLIIGNTLNLLSQLVPIIEFYGRHPVDIQDDEDKVITMLYYRSILNYISLLPSSLMIILYFKSIRHQVCSLLKLKGCRGKF